MSTLTHASQVVNSIEYVEESTYGTMPTNPVMIHLANTAVVRISRNDNIRTWRRLGSEDGYKFTAGRQEYTLTIEGTLPDSASSDDFIRYGINAVSGTGTINKSLSFGWSFKLNGTTNYRTATGCRIQTLRLQADTGTNEVRFSADLIPKSIAIPSTTDYIGTGSHGTANTDAVITFASGGADPVVFNSSAVPTTSINLTWTRNLSNKFVLGSQTIGYQYPTNRVFAGDLSTPYLSTTLETAVNAGTTASLIWTYRSGQTITLSNARLVSLNDETWDADSTDAVEHQYGIESLSQAIA